MRLGLCLLLATILSAAALPAAAGPPDEVGPALRAIEQLRASGDFLGAVKFATDLVAKHPEDVAAHLAYQDAQLALGHEKQLLAEYRVAARPDTAGADAHYLLARLLRGAPAVAEFRAAVKIDPGHFAALCGLGVELTHERVFPEAKGVLDAAAKLKPQSAVPVNLLGRLEEARGKSAEAEQLYRRAIELAPDTTDARVNLGVLLVETGRRKDALETLEDAATRAPKDPMPLVAIGMAQMSARDAGAAVSAYKRALAVCAADVSTLNLIAVAYMDLDQLDLADDALQQATKAAPESALTRLNFAHLRILQNRVDDAAKLAAAAVQADDSSADAHYVLGLVYDHQAQPHKADVEFRRAAKLDDESPVYPRALAALAASQNDWGKAISEYQKALKLTNGSNDVLMELASAYSGADKPKLAAQAYDDVVAVEPERLEAWLQLGIVSRRDLKDDKRAAKAFHEYVKRGGTDQRVPGWLRQLDK